MTQTIQFIRRNPVRMVALFVSPLVAAFLFALPVQATTFVSGTLTTDTVWTTAGSPYAVTDELRVAAGVTLTVEPGVVVKVSEGVPIVIEGTLRAEGTAGQEIVFTSILDDTVAGDTNEDGAATSGGERQWLHIRFENGSVGIFDYAIIRYAGASPVPFSGIENRGGAITLLYSQVLSNGDSGISQSSGSLTIADSEITQHVQGIFVSGGTFSIIDSSIHDNTFYGLRNTSGTLINATNNWWGASSGPLHTTLNPTGAGDRVSDDVDFIPWLIDDPLIPTQPPMLPDTTKGFYSAPSSPNVLASLEPVNTLFGNYFRQDRDIAVSGRGLPLEFTRTYNSLVETSGALGEKWIHNFEANLRIFSSGVIVVNEDGREDAYTKNPDDSFTPRTGVFAMLVENPDGSFMLTRKNQTVLYFDDEGALQTITDRNGNALTLIYNLDGLLTTITDATSRVLQFMYDANDRITALTDPAGQQYVYAYDAQDNLVSFTNPENETTQYVYDADSNLTQIIDANGNTLVENTYQSDRVTLQRDGGGNETTYTYDIINRTTVFTDPRGSAITHIYDEDLRIAETIDALGGTVTFTYDADDNRSGVRDANGNETLFAYDDRGNLTELTDALTNTLEFSYDLQNNLLSATNAKGDVTDFTYDGNGNLITITDALGNETAFVYNAFGELTQTADAKGNVTSFAYDLNGNLATTTDALTSTTTFTYDMLSRLIALEDALGNTVTTTYDDVGRLLETVDPLGNQNSFVYDLVGNITSTADANGNTTAYVYDARYDLIAVEDAESGTTTFTYDAVGNRIEVTDANNNSTTYVFDALNRLITTTDPVGNETTFAYDLIGNVATLINGKGETVTFAYDVLNRLATKTFPDLTETTFAYDENGNMVVAENPDVSYTFAYDALNRLIESTDSRFPAPSTNSGQATSTVAYDANGNRTLLETAFGAEIPVQNAYTYDALNRLTRISDVQSRDYNFAYDELSRRTQLSYPNGIEAAYAYDAADRLLQITHQRQDGYGRHGKPLLNFRYTYDALGNRLTQERKNPSTSLRTSELRTYEYDALSRLLEVSQKKRPQKPKPSPKTVEQYVYDAVGNRLEGPRRRDDYAYNMANELLTARGLAFTYDLNGNVITKVDKKKTWTFAYDPENRLVEDIKTKRDNHDEHDDHDHGDSHDNEHDNEHDNDDDRKTVLYAYDPFGRRIEKKITDDYSND